MHTRRWTSCLAAAGIAVAVLATAGPASAGTLIKRPDGDLTVAWQVRNGTSAWSALDDPVTQPTSVPAGDYIWAARAGAVAEISLGDAPLGDQTATARAWFYANTGATTRLQVQVVSAGASAASHVVPAGSGFAWRSMAVAMSDQALLNDARLRFTALDGPDSNVRAAYLEVDTAPCAATVPTYGGYGPFGGTARPAACWNPHATNSPFNRLLPANPRVRADSGQIITRIRGDIPDGNPSDVDAPANLVAHDDGSSGEPTYYSRPSDPLFRIHCTDFGGSCPIDAAHLPAGIRIPAGAVPEGGPATALNPLTNDRHINVVDQQTGVEYDLWRVQATAPLPAAGGDLNVGFGGYSRIDGAGVDTTGDATAAHFASLAGRLRAEELASGRIDHALFVGVNCDSGSYVFPAQHAGRSCAEIGRSNVYAPPMGSLLQLDLSSTTIDALPVPTWKKTLLHAMAKYGMYIGETGSSGIFSIEAESGNQYTASGSPNLWLSFAQSAGWPHKAASSDYPWSHYLGYMGTNADGIDWDSRVWSHLRVLDPCVAQRTC